MQLHIEQRRMLSKAVTVQMRVFADLAARWLGENGGNCAGGYTRRGALVIVATGERADRIAGELERAGLFRPQRDKPEHLEPDSCRTPAAVTAEAMPATREG